MADEFAKGLAVLVGAGLGWMVLSGWYNTAGFEETQLIAPNPDPSTLTVLDQFGLVLKDALLVFALVGALVFWVGIPLYRAARAELSN